MKKNNITRRNLLGAGLLAAAGLLDLCGCSAADTGVAGKTLYFVSTYSGGKIDDGDEVTITFVDEETYHFFSESNEYTGTWVMEGDDIVLTYAYDTKTLRKLDGEDGYSLDGFEEYGERYYLSEQDAQAWHDEFVGAAPERVSELLESAEWESYNIAASDGSSILAAPTLNVSDGVLTFTAGSYKQPTVGHNGPDEGSWAASDHSGEYSVTVDESSLVSRVSSPSYMLYEGSLTVAGASTDFTFQVEDDSLTLRLGEAGDGDDSFDADAGFKATR